MERREILLLNIHGVYVLSIRWTKDRIDFSPAWIKGSPVSAGEQCEKRACFE